MQSDQRDGLHVAIIMDGNGRWATRRGLPRAAGHRAGVAAVRRVVEHAPGLGIRTLTLYAFSADNWRRPSGEVQTIFWLLRAYLRLEREKLRKQGARLEAIGRRDRIPPALLREIVETEAATAECDRLRLRVAIDYSSRDAIAMAAARVAQAIARGSQIGSSHPLPSAVADDKGWGTPVECSSGAKAPMVLEAQNVRPEGRTFQVDGACNVGAEARTLHEARQAARAKEFSSAGSEMWPSHPLPSAVADDKGWGSPFGTGSDTYAGFQTTNKPLSVDTLRPAVTEVLTADCGEVDLLIRTGGEKRLSDFLLWESAYAELHFTDRMWPEFDAADLEAAVAEFHHRQRRFGGVPETALAPMSASAGGAR